MIWCPLYSLKPQSKTSKSALEKLFCPAACATSFKWLLWILVHGGKSAFSFPSPDPKGTNFLNHSSLCLKEEGSPVDVSDHITKTIPCSWKGWFSGKTSDSMDAWRALQKKRTLNQSEIKYKCRAACNNVLQAETLQNSRNGLKNQIQILVYSNFSGGSGCFGKNKQHL